ncbi:MAG: hypothetical protein ACRDNP_14655 [Gaiellaceae bacterium]
MVESGRKHGPFDIRFPVRRKIATPVWELQPDRDGPGRLEWSTFLARFFPNRRRHDFEALAAYEAYKTRSIERRGAALRDAAARTHQGHGGRPRRRQLSTACQAPPGSNGRRGDCEPAFSVAGAGGLGVGGRQRGTRPRLMVPADSFSVARPREEASKQRSVTGSASVR